MEKPRVKPLFLRKLGDVINKLTFVGIGLGGIAKIFKEMLIY